MIRTLRLRNFKCFDDETFSIGRITLLAGLNGTGKSSVIQGLLALRNCGTFPDSKSWRGPLLDIGTFGDVLYTRADDDQIKLRTRYEDDTELCGDFGPDGTDFYLAGPVAAHDGERSDLARERSLLRDSMFYLSADRLGPRKTLPYMAEGAPAGTPLGKRGQAVLWFMGQHEGDMVAPALRHPAASRTTLLAQTNAWLAAVSPGVELASESVSAADLAAAGYSFEQKWDARTKPFRANNIGFGASCVLPLIVALLAAERDDLVIIENPEAHLHPGGQTNVAELAARAAADGRQVILETHSDHVLDGIRLAVAEKIVSAEDVVVYFFRHDSAGVQIASPKVRADGSLDSWPDGFFDQQERNLSRLIRLRRSDADSSIVPGDRGGRRDGADDRGGHRG